MLEDLKARFGEEKAAIETLRAMHPSMNQKTLARKIRGMDFSQFDIRVIAGRACARTLLSIYSVIRRYDKAQAAKKMALGAAYGMADATNTLTKGQLATA